MKTTYAQISTFTIDSPEHSPPSSPTPLNRISNVAIELAVQSSQSSSSQYSRIDLPPSTTCTPHNHNNIPCPSRQSPKPKRGRQTVPPSNYICPLTLEVFDEPVNDICGHSYERDAILSWLEVHEICPISRKPLSRDDVLPNHALKSRIQQWKSEHDYSEGADDVEFGAAVVATATRMACFDSNMETTSVSKDRNETYSPIELMLLPQERAVLRIVHLRAVDRQRLRRKRNVLCALGGFFTAAVVIGMAMFLRILQDDEERR
jgi:hypothetical protein